MTRPRAVSQPSIKKFTEFRGEEIQVLERFTDGCVKRGEPFKQAILRMMKKELS